MRLLRRIHLYLGCFFSPLLIFYVASGWYQTFQTNRTKTLGEPDNWIARLTSVHVDQIFPSDRVESYSPLIFRWLVAAMSVALIATVILGIILAFRSLRKTWTVWIMLSLGVIVPIAALWLGMDR